MSTPGVGGHFSVMAMPELRLAAVRRDARPWAGRDRTKLDLKLRALGYLDASGQDRPRDVLEIQNITVHPSQRRRGLATALLRKVASVYPEALIQGSNPSADAKAWHLHLNSVMPTRMLEFANASGLDVRIQLVPMLDYGELSRPD